MLRKLFTFFILLLLSLTVQAKVLVISDIDDTLKISHVHSKIDSFFNMFKHRVIFKGMPEVLQQLATDGAEITYLSNAPRWLMGNSHSQFIKINNFPTGKIILRSKLDKTKHKLTHMRQLINRLHPSMVILIGDNGENDPQFQYQIRQEFPQIKIYSFIHVAYNLKKLPHNTFTFVTALALTKELRDLGVISDVRADQLLTMVSQGIKRERYAGSRTAHFIPAWLRCRGYFFDASNETTIVQQAADKINRQCQK